MSSCPSQLPLTNFKMPNASLAAALCSKLIGPHGAKLNLRCLINMLLSTCMVPQSCVPPFPRKLLFSSPYGAMYSKQMAAAKLAMSAMDNLTARVPVRNPSLLADTYVASISQARITISIGLSLPHRNWIAYSADATNAFAYSPPPPPMASYRLHEVRQSIHPTV